MRGNITIEVNKATVLEALQDYFDKQLSVSHLVKDVKTSTGGYGGGTFFTVELAEIEPQVVPA